MSKDKPTKIKFKVKKTQAPEPIALREVPSDIDWAKADEHLSSIIKEALMYAGRIGFNPFFWLGDIVQPIVDELKAGVRSDPLYQRVMKLSFKEEYARVPYMRPPPTKD